MQQIRVVDTHTGGEPTRIVVSSPLELNTGSMQTRRDSFRDQFDAFRRAIVCEPRGSDVCVGAIVLPPEHSSSVAGVIFFNNVGYLGMCGHGTIGVAIALSHLGRIGVGRHELDTPVGTVQFLLHDDHRVSLDNVPSFRFRKQVRLQLDDGRSVHGDIAWGGNWFFICEDHGLALDLANLAELESLSRSMRRQLDLQAVTGKDGEVIDHVELVGPPSSPDRADAKNFVLCPGSAYDRSPCGTGTSAKVACLAADGKLAPGAIYRQESIVGTVFEASFRHLDPHHILPTITGDAFVTGEGDLLLDPNDPFCMGFPS